MIDVAFGNDFRPTTSHTVVATLNKVLAAHSLKGGMEMRIYREDSLSTANAQAGQYAFTNAYTRQSSASGTDYQGLQNYASFLLGLPTTTSLAARLGLLRVLQDVGLLRPGRLAGQQQADPEPRPALRGRDGAHRAQRQERLRLRLRLHPADRGDGPGAVRGPQRSRPEGARSAAERQGRPHVRGRRRLEPAVRDAEEHLPAALRVRLPAEPQDGHPRRRRALRRLPRAAARRRVPERLVPDDHRRHGQQRLRGARSRGAGTRVSHHPDPGAGRQRERPAAGPRAGDRLLQPEPGHLEAAPLADRLPARAAGGLRGRGRVRRQLRLRHRDHPQHQRPAERVPEHGQLPHGRDERQQHVPDRRGREPVRRAAAGDRASTTRPSPARSCCARTRSSGTSGRRTTTASPGTTPPRSACRSGSRRATRWESPTPTRTGCRRRST